MAPLAPGSQPVDPTRGPIPGASTFSSRADPAPRGGASSYGGRTMWSCCAQRTRPACRWMAQYDEGRGSEPAPTICNHSSSPRPRRTAGAPTQGHHPGNGYHCVPNPMTFRQWGQKKTKPLPIPNGPRSLRMWISGSSSSHCGHKGTRSSRRTAEHGFGLVDVLTATSTPKVRPHAARKPGPTGAILWPVPQASSWRGLVRATM